MNAFRYKKSRLYCEDVSLEALAEKVGTPFYVYSHHTLRRHILAYKKAFAAVPHLIAFAVKANANIAVLRVFANEGGGGDIVSSGELHRALKAGMDPKNLVFAGVGKTRKEMKEALRAGILMFNVESAQELVALDETAKGLGVKAPVALRVNPDVNPRTHPYISTGLKKSKFGIEIIKAESEYQTASRLSHIEVVGVHSHIGSQLTQVKPFVDALKRLSKLIAALRKQGLDIQYWNIGGGLGITYNEEKPPLPKEMADAILPLLKKSGCRIILEPGRSLAGNAGVLVTRVIYNKEGEAKNFLVVDAGMNDLIRPSLYNAYHELQPVVKRRRKTKVVDVVGPICESGDFLAQDRVLPQMAPDELLAVMSAGAYSFTMSSNYNARPRPPEILVHGDSYDMVRKRETLKDLLRGESIPAFLDQKK
ncbi:MAG: diaminopimelate decarboxylase [Nitrospira sp.]|nr:diaminopimelate decarboxylase [Candidatus Manganitrophaceae bacterium]HIL33858.1 diaminopimelate decarboxylase [Candidatus Manganitrophaceae bacterium]